jgi:phosphoribosylaminoimidazolecarboxamide formyltransferase/IMP cyclohydrolase
MRALDQHGIGTIDLLCVNLYPFLATVLKPNVTLEDAIENIDIGGPAMVRSASKNHESVTVVVDPADYEPILAELQAQDGETKTETRKVLAAKAFAHTARYDAMISRYLREQFQPGEWPKELTLGYTLAQQCRYGENPHQHAAFYREIGVREPCVATAKQINGKELSFNNIFDLNAALETVKEFPEGEAAVIIKHANPCGAALGDTLAEAFRKAREGDPISAFGGILALNRPVDVDTAEEITGKSTFFEAIIAPGYAPEAIPILVEKKKWGANLRLLEVGDLRGWHTRAWGQDMKKVVGGILIQDRDLLEQSAGALKVVTTRTPTEEELAEMLFAWRVMRHVKSNAIAFSRGLQIIGVGAGQMNRVQSVQLAVKQAEAHAGGAQGGVMASDAFFPFPDGPTAAADAGITAIIQPGGSVKDQETIDLCNERGIAMVFTGARHFLH